MINALVKTTIGQCTIKCRSANPESLSADPVLAYAYAYACSRSRSRSFLLTVPTPNALTGYTCPYTTSYLPTTAYLDLACSAASA